MSSSAPVLVLLSLLVAAPAISANQPTAKSIGWIEEGLLLPENVSLKMKLDTGALTSSMDASDIKRFEKDGEKWVKFNVEVQDSNTEKSVSIPFERKVERNIKVRGAGGADRRPVVRLKMCIGNKIYDEEFSLNNRSKMLYPVLIGRRTLEHLGAVDVSRTFTVEPKCSKTS
ncbi:retropepsin-like aspartic peptidase RloA3 [Pseudomonas sp. Gutcm_11s]|uniref:retropepsin-like aspartic peptidase RloA3 n=1 Tax=Pseudomonas sp. Gutcm_11s TaxID=3026088 RepID=UPI00236272AB|nr:ATP-dependent zinc protease [Pseudomonas sp. Gutcm_11s]MDD0842564.1 ATP-dependent zinc protease [Pseudomonas sp. Gutcm_11s]